MASSIINESNNSTSSNRTLIVTGILTGWTREDRVLLQGRKYSVYYSPCNRRFYSFSSCVRFIKGVKSSKRNSPLGKTTVPKAKAKLTLFKKSIVKTKNSRRSTPKRRVHVDASELYDESGCLVQRNALRTKSTITPKIGVHPAGDDLPNWTVEHVDAIDGTSFWLYRDPFGNAVGSRGTALLWTGQLEVPDNVAQSLQAIDKDKKMLESMMTQAIVVPEYKLRSAPLDPQECLPKCNSLLNEYDSFFSRSSREKNCKKMRAVQSISSRMVVVDLYCGIGGFSMGANSMGFAHCIGVDQEVNCCATYHCNKCGSEALVATLDGTTLTKYIRVLSPHKDSLVILASPPCQPYSNRGHHGGLTDVRDGLPFLLKLCTAVMPIALAIENVPQVLTKHRKHFEAFVQSMSEHGYDHNVDLIDARHFNIAQRRKRIIAIFVRKQLPYDQVQASKITQLALQKGMLQADGKTSLELVKMTTDHEAVTAGRVLTDPSLWIGTRLPDAQPTLSFLKSRSRLAHGHQGTGLVFWDEPAPTLLTSSLNDGSYDRLASVPMDVPYNQLTNQHIRPLSVLHGLALQGFPSEFRLYGHARFQSYVIGNALPPSIARAASKALLLRLKQMGYTPPDIDPKQTLVQIKRDLLE